MTRTVNLLSDDEKRRIVEEYLKGGISQKEMAHTWGVSPAALCKWIICYKTNGTFSRYEDVKKNYTTTTMKESSIGAYKSEIARLKAALEEAELRAHALDTMIDVAEETLNINIRKKAGAKQ